MKSKNIERIMAFAKSEKPMYKIVLNVYDVIKEGGAVRTERIGKYTCIDDLGNVFKVETLDESLVRRNATYKNTMFLEMVDDEAVDLMVRFYAELQTGRYGKWNNG